MLRNQKNLKPMIYEIILSEEEIKTLLQIIDEWGSIEQHIPIGKVYQVQQEIKYQYEQQSK